MKTTAHIEQTTTATTAAATLDIEVEELEEIMAPEILGRTINNHYETFVCDEEPAAGRRPAGFALAWEEC